MRLEKSANSSNAYEQSNVIEPCVKSLREHSSAGAD